MDHLLYKSLRSIRYYYRNNIVIRASAFISNAAEKVKVNYVRFQRQSSCVNRLGPALTRSYLLVIRRDLDMNENINSGTEAHLKNTHTYFGHLWHAMCYMECVGNKISQEECEKGSG